MRRLSAAVTARITAASADVFSSLPTARLPQASGRTDAAVVGCVVLGCLQGADAMTPCGCELLQRQILAAIEALRADLERGNLTTRGKVPLTSDDRELLGRLLPPIGGVFGPTEFLTRDLFQSDSAALRLVLDGLNAKRIGKLFGRAVGEPIDGYVVTRAGTGLNAQLWRIVRF